MTTPVGVCLIELDPTNEPKALYEMLKSGSNINTFGKHQYFVSHAECANLRKIGIEPKVLKEY